MLALRFSYICLGSLLLLLLVACAAEDGDLTAPDATIDGGIQSPTTSTSVVITGTMASDAFITADVTLPAIAVVTDRNYVNGTWECTVTGMVNGPNTVLVSATDSTGNTRQMTVTITVDLVGPTTTILQYPEISKSGAYNFAGTVTEAGSTVSVEVFDSGGLTTGINGSASVDVSSGFNVYTWNVDLDLSALIDGDYTVIATGTDPLGNDSETPAEQIISFSSASPDFAITTPSTIPVVLNTGVDFQLFNGTALASSTLTVTPSTTVNEPDAFGNWDAAISGFVGGNTVVTFDVNDGGTIQKVLVVRDQTAPTVFDWSSLTNSTITVEFDESMNVTTILPENLLIEDSSETIFDVLSVVQDNDRTFTFTTELLPTGDTYTATLQPPQLINNCPVVDGCTVEDGRGNGITTSDVWWFNK